MVLHENTSPRSILLLLLFVPVMCGYDGGVGSVAHRPDLGQGDEMPGDISEELRNAISFYRSEILECTGGSCGDADLWRGLCVALRRAEQFSACLEATQTLLRIDPSPVNHRDAGLLLSLMEKRQAAARQLEESVRKGALSWTSILMIGLDKLRLGMRESAVSTLRLVTRLAPSHHAGYPSAALATALILSQKHPGQHLHSASGLLPRMGTDGLGLVWLDDSAASAVRYREAAERVRRECVAEQDVRDRDAKLLRAELESLQSRGSCEGSSVVVYTLTGVSDGVGLGCELHLMSMALSAAYSQNKTLVLDPAAHWWHAGDATEKCPVPGGGSGWGCFFEEIGECTDTAAAEAEKADVRAERWMPGERSARLWVPHKYRRHGLLWWRSQLLAYLFRPKQAIVDAANAMGDAPSVAVHVRRGDKGSEALPPPVSLYHRSALTLLRASTGSNPAVSSGPKQAVFLVVSDDAEAASNLTASLLSSGMGTAHRGMGCASSGDKSRDEVGRSSSSSSSSSPWHCAARGHRVYTRSGSLAKNFPGSASSIPSMTAQAISDLLLISSADSIVTSMTSNFGRLAYELAYARTNGCSPPPVSVDVVWHDPH